VNALYRLRITDQLFKSTLLHEWCDLNRLSNAYFDARFKKTPFICYSEQTVYYVMRSKNEVLCAAAGRLAAERSEADKPAKC
jgi:hypothetical protein